MMRSQAYFLSFLTFLVIAQRTYGIPELTPEEETKRIARLLKPISDEKWNQIAGDKLREQYQIVRGDTLFDVSKRFFGDPYYWPKVWAVNNGNIKNPHLIYPGNQIAFLPGSGSTLPSFEIGGKHESLSGRPPGTQIADASMGRSQEWKQLPRQRWQPVDAALPAEVDPLGFDKNNKVRFSQSKGFVPNAIVSSDSLPFLGEVNGARTPFTFLGLRDVIYITPGAELQVGLSYTLTQEPFSLRSEIGGKQAYSFLNLGTVKLIGVRDDVFIGVITMAKAPIPRGTRLIRQMDRIPEYSPKPGPDPMEATLVVDRNVSSTFTTAQFKQVFVDRGSDDGIEPGMVFRAYQYTDPLTKKVIMSSDYVIDADLLVIQVSPQFSTAIVIESNRTILENAPLVLLTDVSSVGRRGIPDALRSGNGMELDDLDSLDSGNSMTESEQRELEQLEDWKKEDAAEVEEPASLDTESEFAPIPEEGPASDAQEATPPPPPSDPSLAPPTEGDPSAPPSDEFEEDLFEEVTVE